MFERFDCGVRVFGPHIRARSLGRTVGRVGPDSEHSGPWLAITMRSPAAWRPQAGGIRAHQRCGSPRPTRGSPAPTWPEGGGWWYWKTGEDRPSSAAAPSAGGRTTVGAPPPPPDNGAIRWRCARSTAATAGGAPSCDRRHGHERNGGAAPWVYQFWSSPGNHVGTDRLVSASDQVGASLIKYFPILGRFKQSRVVPRCL